MDETGHKQECSDSASTWRPILGRSRDRISIARFRDSASARITAALREDANGLRLATIHCRDDLQKLSFGHGYLTSDEAKQMTDPPPAHEPPITRRRVGSLEQEHPEWFGARALSTRE